jgi:hypothetical protein
LSLTPPAIGLPLVGAPAVNRLTPQTQTAPQRSTQVPGRNNTSLYRAPPLAAKKLKTSTQNRAMKMHDLSINPGD